MQDRELNGTQLLRAGLHRAREVTVIEARQKDSKMRKEKSLPLLILFEPLVGCQVKNFTTVRENTQQNHVKTTSIGAIFLSLKDFTNKNAKAATHHG